MSKPFIHATSSARRYGGIPEDYIEIHNFMDASKGVVADSRHRALTHNTWFLSVVLEKVFGTTITTSTGRKVSVRDIGEQHVAEDFGGRFIPSAQDYLEEMEFRDWMFNGRGEAPASAVKLPHYRSKDARNSSGFARSEGDDGQADRAAASAGDEGVCGDRAAVV